MLLAENVSWENKRLEKYTQERTRLKIDTALNSQSGFEENPVADTDLSLW